MRLLHLYRKQITSNGFFPCLSKWADTGRLASYVERLKRFFCGFLLLYYIKQIDSMLLCVCSVVHHRRCQEAARTSVTHSTIALCATF